MWRNLETVLGNRLGNIILKIEFIKILMQLVMIVYFVYKKKVTILLCLKVKTVVNVL